MKHKLLYFPLSTNIYNVSCTRINNKQLIRVIYLKVQTIFRDNSTLSTLSLTKLHISRGKVNSSSLLQAEFDHYIYIYSISSSSVENKCTSNMLLTEMCQICSNLNRLQALRFKHLHTDLYMVEDSDIFSHLSQRETFQICELPNNWPCTSEGY